MIPELGQFALCLALLLTLFEAWAGLYGATRPTGVAPPSR